jgi:hypothetical protein
MMGEQLWAEAGFACLPGSEVAVLPVGNPVQGDGIRGLYVRHK